MTKKEPAKPSRLETILAFMAIGVIGASLISMMVALATSFFGWKTNLAIFAQIPLLGLPFGFILVMVLLVVSLSRKARENRA
jgi:hypothetical protein